MDKHWQKRIEEGFLNYVYHGFNARWSGCIPSTLLDDFFFTIVEEMELVIRDPEFIDCNLPWQLHGWGGRSDK